MTNPICVNPGHSADVPCNLEIVLLGNHIEVNNEQRSGMAVTEELVSSLVLEGKTEVLVRMTCLGEALLESFYLCFL